MDRHMPSSSNGYGNGTCLSNGCVKQKQRHLSSLKGNCTPPPPYSKQPTTTALQEPRAIGALPPILLPASPFQMDIVQEVHLPPKKNRKVCSTCLTRFLLLVFVAVLCVGIILGFLYIFDTRRSSDDPSTNETYVKVVGSLDDHVNKDLHAPSSFVSSPQPTPVMNGLTKEQRCLKNCYDNVYITCPCNQKICECPVVGPVKQIDQGESITSSISIGDGGLGPVGGFLAGLGVLNQKIHDESKVAMMSINKLCIALCGNNFQRPITVPCEKLLFACDNIF